MTDYPPPSDDDLRQITEQVWSSYLDADGSQPLMPFPAQTRSQEVSASVSMMTIRQLPVPDVWAKKCPARRTSSTVMAVFTLPDFSSTGRVR